MSGFHIPISSGTRWGVPFLVAFAHPAFAQNMPPDEEKPAEPTAEPAGEPAGEPNVFDRAFEEPMPEEPAGPPPPLYISNLRPLPPILVEVPPPPPVLPPSVRAMLDAAIATQDKAKVAAVVDLAKDTNPGFKDEIDDMEDAFLARQARLAREEKRQKERRIRAAGLLDMWTGKVEAGALRETGNTRSLGVTTGVTVNREGLQWVHKVHALFDYQKTNGVKTREQYLLSYEPQWNINQDLFFLYGLSKFERDRFQGYNQRYSISGGVGYRIINTDRVKLSIQSGPAWRKVNFTDGTNEMKVNGLAAVNLDWQLNDSVKLTQNADAYVQSGNSTLNSTTALEASLIGNLSAKASYAVEYNSEPLEGSVQTDTITRFTLVYGF
ncbi:DUF481 domain-containing protein [Altericroceibacterium spongiae]|uniref:DUF481 domain-containing protein n=1 Tax=Altericroceibacterium spongiae TaxID=2320269 RepID=A0A420EQV9_9SPHN|nr:DUF481 domain-containing protein [Altericroceibacterium spongiae]RKF23059.1 DUF481 domain-containing protein [Altericroceibacterium spongiae]